MKVRELFSVRRGSCRGADNYEPGSFPLVSASTVNNGVAGHISFQPKDKLFNELPCLSVAVVGEGGTMFSALQSQEFYATHHTEILTPKKHEFWDTDKVAKLVAVAAFLRKQRWRFHYMRPAGGRLADLDIDMAAVMEVALKILQEKGI